MAALFVCNRFEALLIIYCSGTNSCPVQGDTTGVSAALYTAVGEYFGGVLAILKVFAAEIYKILSIKRFDIAI